jgi:3-oxoacyl-[acyl-carrier protein] reductase
MGLLSKPRRILITGASRGIGRAAALALGARGHCLILVARGQPALEQVAAQIRDAGGRAQAFALDLTDSASVQATLARVLADGPIDVLVNNAGTVYQSEFLTQSEPRLREEIELNYFGALHMIRALLPSFLLRRQGAIVNVSSLLGSVAAPTTANFSGSKAALEAFSRGLRGEVERWGIRVTVFVAPHTQTELGTRTDFRRVKSLPVAYVATQLVRAIDHTPARYAASPVYRVLLRLAAWFPRWMERQVASSVQHLLREPPSPGGN